MDGVEPLKVPTLVIGLTNKRSLIEPALLRPGRFEVQIEITPPKTVAQRCSILKVHTKQMFDAGRLEVKDPPPGTAAATAAAVQQLQPQYLKIMNNNDDLNSNTILNYDELITKLAVKCDGFSGASIAGVARAAASRALKRAVSQLADGLEYSSSADDDTKSIADSSTSTKRNIMDCLVTQDDFYEAIQDVRKDRSGTNRDYADDDDRDHNDEDNNTVSTVQRNGREGFRTRLKQKIRDWVLS